MWKLFGIDVNNSRQNGSTFDFEKTSVLQHQIQQETYVSKQNILIVTKGVISLFSYKVLSFSKKQILIKIL